MGDISVQSFPPDAISDQIVGRHSVRRFLPTPIPRDPVEKSLAIAQHTASNNNFQPWRSVVVTGEKLQSLKSALTKAWDVSLPDLPGFPSEYQHYKTTFGEELFGKLLRIPHDEPEKIHTAIAENYDLYRAPMAMIVYIDKRLSKGIEATHMASIIGYPELLREELGLPEDIELLAGIALGYKDPDHVRNALDLKKDDWRGSVGL